MDTAEFLSWAVPARYAVEDARRIGKARGMADRAAHRERTVEATIASIGGVSRHEARMEIMDAHVTGDTAADPVERAVAVAMARTLRWLLDRDAPPPFDLPQRHSDGTLMDEDALFDREWLKRGEHENRHAVRDRARRLAAQSAALAALADSVT